MSETRLSKLMLFGEMMKKRPAVHRPRRDFVSNNLILGIDGWYELCQDRGCCYHAEISGGYFPVTYLLPTNNSKVDLPHINVGELSAELETVQDIARDNS